MEPLLEGFPDLLLGHPPRPKRAGDVLAEAEHQVATAGAEHRVQAFDKGDPVDVRQNMEQAGVEDDVEPFAQRCEIANVMHEEADAQVPLAGLVLCDGDGRPRRIDTGGIQPESCRHEGEFSGAATDVEDATVDRPRVGGHDEGLLWTAYVPRWCTGIVGVEVAGGNCSLWCSLRSLGFGVRHRRPPTLFANWNVQTRSLASDDVALLEVLDLSPAHVATNSYGGNIALRLAARRPELFRTLSCHEPPLFGVLDGNPETDAMLARDARTLATIGQHIADGEHAVAARQFVDEVVFGPGAWNNALPAETRAIMVANNAPTFLDELQDPNQLTADRDALAGLEVPVRLTNGTESPPVFARVIDRLVALIPDATRETIDSAGHVPHLTTPERCVQAMTRAASAAVVGREKSSSFR